MPASHLPVNGHEEHGRVRDELSLGLALELSQSYSNKIRLRPASHLPYLSMAMKSMVGESFR